MERKEKRNTNKKNAIIFCGIFYTTKMQFVAQWLEVQVIPISISIGYQCSTKVRYHVIVTVCMLHS